MGDSKKNQEKEVVVENSCERYDRIAGMRNRYIESLRRIERQEVIEPLPDPDEQLFDPMNHGPGHPYPDRIEFKMTITGSCAICEQILSEDFPEDYPDEYKFCCNCLSWARVIAMDEKESLLTEAIKVSSLCHKILKRMTLYDGKSKRAR